MKTTSHESAFKKKYQTQVKLLNKQIPGKEEIFYYQTIARAEIMKKYQSSATFYAMHALGEWLHPKQVETLDAISNNRKVIVYANHGASKTRTAAIVARWFYDCFQESRVISTAPTFQQVANLLWKELIQMYVEGRVQHQWKVNTLDVQDPFNAKHFVKGISTDKPVRLEGHHAVRLLWIIDEMKGFREELWKAIKGSLSNVHSKVIGLSTTDGVEPGSLFYNIVDRHPDFDDWVHVKITINDMPEFNKQDWVGIEWLDDEGLNWRYVTKKWNEMEVPISGEMWRAECEKEWGIESPLYRSKVLAELADITEESVIKMLYFEKMWANWQDIDLNNLSGKKVLGVDPAGEGEDFTALWYRVGDVFVKSAKFHIGDQNDLVSQAENFINFDKEVEIRVDQTGLGLGVCQEFKRRGYKTIGIFFNGQSTSPLYADRITDMFFHFKHNYHRFAMQKTPEAQETMKQLCGRRIGGTSFTKRFNSDALYIESKKTYKARNDGKSPDLGDAFLLAGMDIESKTFRGAVVL